MDAIRQYILNNPQQWELIRKTPPQPGQLDIYQKNACYTAGVLMAERAGFEPAEPCGSHALQACALGQTTQPLRIKLCNFEQLSARDYTTRRTRCG